MATLDNWAEVLAVAAGPWKRTEMREFAVEILESLVVETTDTTLRLVREEVRREISDALGSGADPTPLVRVLARIARVTSEAILTETAQRSYELPRPRLQSTPV